MSVLFDTSALVAVLIAQHPEHDSARACFINHQTNGYICVSTHGLAELFAVLTRIPHWRVSVEQARQIIHSLRPHVTVVALDEDDYMWAIDRMVSLGIAGGAIYDCLHARAALKAEATTIYTFNTKHFARLGDEVNALVRKP